MQTTTLARTGRRTALIATAFVAANILLPQLCHLATLGGPTWLPIYLLTLLGAYIFGWQVGLLTAVASPVLNMALFGMPAAAALPAILAKSVILALAAAWLGRRSRLSVPLNVLIAIAAYHGLGTLAEYAMTGSIYDALQDLRIGYPGILAQYIIATIMLTLTTKRK